MDWLLYALIGAGAGWLVAWATDKSGSNMVKPIAIGAAGALAGAAAILFLAKLAPVVGAALGAIALLQFVSKRSTARLTTAAKK